MIGWTPLSPAPAAGAGLPPFGVEEGFTDVARKPKGLRPFGVAVVRSESHWFAELAVFLVAVVLCVSGIRIFVAQPFYIPSGSMLPQLQVNDRIIVNKLAYTLGEPQRGDIVVFDAPPGVAQQQLTPVQQPPKSPLRRGLEAVGRFMGVVPPPTDEFVKRVIGLPGETVHIVNGGVYIDGKPLHEPYLDDTVITAAGEGAFGHEPIKIREGELWVMGDNRGGSADARTFGPIKQDTVVGRAFVKVWPFRSASFL